LIAEEYTSVGKFLQRQPAYTKTTATDLKLLRHICVLTVILNDDFAVTIGEFAKDLNLTPQMAKFHLTAVGCHPIYTKRYTKEVKDEDEAEKEHETPKKSVALTAKLTAPLKFPELKRVRRKRRVST